MDIKCKIYDIQTWKKKEKSYFSTYPPKENNKPISNKTFLVG
jgi:hypothetical protein